MSASAKRCNQCGVEAPADLFRCPDCEAWLPAKSRGDRLAARLDAALGEGYRLEERIGRGGCAYVFRVRDLRLERDLAVKVLLPSLAGSEELADRFRRETRVAAALTHPNIVPIYFLGPDDGLPWYAMPRIHGESLAERMKREGPQPYDVALGIARDVAAALDAAHAAGVIHRDVKPANILLELASGRALLTDFGIAKAMSGDSLFRTASGMVVGTPYYVSPEQAAADPDVDGRSNVYSLAVVLYEMLAGEPPFKGPSAQAVFAAHQSHAPPPLTTRRPDLRAGVADTLMAGLAKDPAARPATPGDLVALIERAQGRASLLRLAGHDSPAVRVAMVVGRQLVVDKQVAVRRAGLAVLGASGRRDAIPDLEGVLTRGDREEKLGALEALAASGLAEAVRPLAAVLQDRRFFQGGGHTDLRRAAARALATLPQPAAREALAACRDDKDEAVRAVAREAGAQTLDE